MYIHTHVSVMYIIVSTYVCMYAYIIIHICTYINMMCMYVHVCICMYVYTYVHTYIRMCICTYVCIYVRTYVCACGHAYTHRNVSFKRFSKNIPKLIRFNSLSRMIWTCIPHSNEMTTTCTCMYVNTITCTCMYVNTITCTTTCKYHHMYYCM